jgi:hypothetical protein
MAREERYFQSPTAEGCRINLLCIVHCSKKCSKHLHSLKAKEEHKKS